MAQSGIFNILPTDYQLYLESMMPSMNEVPIGSEYFDDEMTDQIRDNVLSNYFGNTSLSQDTGKVEGTIGEMDYWSDRYSKGYQDPDTLTGYNKLFNSLGSYNYKFNRPSAPTFDNASIDITDRYDWNPDYGVIEYENEFDMPTFQALKSGTQKKLGAPVSYGWTGMYDDPNRRGDVTGSMLAKHLWNQKIGVNNRGGGGESRGLDLPNTAEMLGNYFGHRASEGEGRNVNFNIPVSNETIRNYQPTNVSSNRERSVGPPGRNYRAGGIVSLVV